MSTGRSGKTGLASSLRPQHNCARIDKSAQKTHHGAFPSVNRSAVSEGTLSCNKETHTPTSVLLCVIPHHRASHRGKGGTVRGRKPRTTLSFRTESRSGRRAIKCGAEHTCRCGRRKSVKVVQQVVHQPQQRAEKKRGCVRSYPNNLTCC